MWVSEEKYIRLERKIDAANAGYSELTKTVNDLIEEIRKDKTPKSSNSNIWYWYPSLDRYVPPKKPTSIKKTLELLMEHLGVEIEHIEEGVKLVKVKNAKK